VQARRVYSSQSHWSRRRRTYTIPFVQPSRLKSFCYKHLQNIIKIAIDNIDGGNTYAFKLANLLVLINTVFYNPAAALHLMENYKPGAARLFFDKWFAAINSEDKLPRVHDKKLSLLALSKLLEVDEAMIPASLRQGWLGIVGGALVIFKSLPQAISSAFGIFVCVDDVDFHDRTQGIGAKFDR